MTSIVLYKSDKIFGVESGYFIYTTSVPWKAMRGAVHLNCSLRDLAESDCAYQLEPCGRLKIIKDRFQNRAEELLSKIRHHTGPSIGPALTLGRNDCGMSASIAFSRATESRVSSVSLASVGES